jgi:hypothetical protein
VEPLDRQHNEATMNQIKFADLLTPDELAKHEALMAELDRHVSWARATIPTRAKVRSPGSPGFALVDPEGGVTTDVELMDWSKQDWISAIGGGFTLRPMSGAEVARWLVDQAEAVRIARALPDRCGV